MSTVSFLDRLIRKTSPEFSVALSTAKGVTQLLVAQAAIISRLDAINERLDKLER